MSKAILMMLLTLLSSSAVAASGNSVVPPVETVLDKTNDQLSSALEELNDLSQTLQGDADNNASDHVYWVASSFNNKIDFYSTLVFMTKMASCVPDRKVIGRFATIQLKSLRKSCNEDPTIQSSLTRQSGHAKNPAMVLQIIKVRDKVAEICGMIH